MPSPTVKAAVTRFDSTGTTAGTLLHPRNVHNSCVLHLRLRPMSKTLCQFRSPSLVCVFVCARALHIKEALHVSAQTYVNSVCSVCVEALFVSSGRKLHFGAAESCVNFAFFGIEQLMHGQRVGIKGHNPLFPSINSFASA